MIAPWIVASIGMLLTFLFTSTQVQNAVQIGTSGILSSIVLRGMGKGREIVAAAVHLADQLAERSKSAEQAADAGEHLAPVVPLPQQRSEVS